MALDNIYILTINSSDLQTQDIFLFACVFFSLFHQSLIVFIAQIFPSLVNRFLKYFIVFDATLNKIVLFLFQIFCCIEIQLLSVC